MFPIWCARMWGAGGSYNYAASCGIPSVLLERGSMGGWTMEEVQSTKKDVRSILDYLDIYPAGHIPRTHYPLDVTEVQYQAASCFGLLVSGKAPPEICSDGESCWV